ncbi:MAG: PIN domain-containing protein [Verrucomicrobia bacterium]|nr:MAG: PIN domain-containing protein [Verrucomicrobiota bacterium]
MIGCDTSFLISVFVRDKNHLRARSLLFNTDEAIHLSRLNQLEFQISIRRLIGAQLLEEAQALRAIREFEAMMHVGAFVDSKTLETSVWDTALDLSRRYSSAFLVRSLDVWQVAFALEMGMGEFWTFDDRQGQLADAVGLKVNS